jgi:pyruvate,orthophosphate dikinase
MTMANDSANPIRWVYGFGGGSADGDAKMKNLLGGKGANLAEMSALGLPVPPGFTITTEACVHYYSNRKTNPAHLEDQVRAGLAKVEAITGKVFGDPANPLLVSVRSGARASMPGIEARAPDRTETSSGLAGSPNTLPVIASTFFRPALTCCARSAG